MFNCFIGGAFLSENMAYFHIATTENIWKITYKETKWYAKMSSLKHSPWDTPHNSLCLSEPEVLRWPWEGRCQQKEEMDSDSFFSKCSNQHFVIIYWCKCLVCFHITLYFYSPLNATEQSYYLRVLVAHIQPKNIPVHQTKNFNYTVILGTLTDRGKNQ